MTLIVLQDRQDITAGTQLLLHRRYETGQFALDLLSALGDLLLRLATLFEVEQNRQQHHDGREQGENKQARNNRQQHSSGFENGICRVNLRRHVHASSTQRALHAVTLVLIHTDEVGKLDSPAKEESVQRLHPLFLCPPCGEKRLLRGKTGQLQDVCQNEEQASSNGDAEKK